MARFKIGCSTITWRRSAPLETMLAEIAAVGYVGTPVAYRDGDDPAAVARIYRSAGLEPAPGYLGAELHEPGLRAAILERARRQADFSAALGLTELFVAGNCFPARFAVAGHETANRSDQLSDEGYRTMAHALNEVGRICRERGVRACFHNHAGSYVETRDELDRLLGLTDPELVAVGLDTGHLAYAGADVANAVRAYAPRIRALHLKDVRSDVLAEGRQEGWDYHTMQARGIWAELGEGVVDFPAVFDALRAVGYDGWTIVEIDQTTMPTPRDSIEACYAYLRRLGLTEEPA